MCHFPFFLTRLLCLFPQEMIIDKVNGHPVPRYLIYDIIKFNVSSLAIFFICCLSFNLSFILKICLLKM